MYIVAFISFHMYEVIVYSHIKSRPSLVLNDKLNVYNNIIIVLFL